MDIKLIALDMDGTTLQKDYMSISERTEKVLKEAIARGIHVVPSTGRILGQLPDSIVRIPGIHYAVTSNGAAVMNLQTGEAISNNFIGAGSVIKIVRTLARRGLFCEVHYKGYSYSNNRYLERVERIEDFPSDQLKFIQYKSKQVEDVLAFTREHAAEIEKINIPLLDDQTHRNLWQKFSQIHGVTLTKAVAGNIEINHRLANKGDGLKQLCKQLKLEPKHVMAIGDSDNDLRMIEFAGLGVAMGNAPDEVKALANRVTLPFDQDGVAHAIEKYALA